MLFRKLPVLREFSLVVAGEHIDLAWVWSNHAAPPEVRVLRSTEWFCELPSAFVDGSWGQELVYSGSGSGCSPPGVDDAMEGFYSVFARLPGGDWRKPVRLRLHKASRPPVPAADQFAGGDRSGAIEDSLRLVEITGHEESSPVALTVRGARYESAAAIRDAEPAFPYEPSASTPVVVPVPRQVAAAPEPSSAGATELTAAASTAGRPDLTMTPAVESGSDADRRVALEPQGLWERGIATFIDYILASFASSWAIALVLAPLTGVGTGRGLLSIVPTSLGTIGVWAFWAFARGGVFFAYFTIAEAKWGTTVGKKVLGMSVVMADRSPLTTHAVVVRNLCKAITLMVPLAWLVTVYYILTAKCHQRLGDQYAGTVVVKPAAPKAVIWR